MPVLVGDVRLLRLDYNPGEVQAASGRGKAAINSLAAEPVDQCRVYWKSDDAKVRILQVTETAFNVIRCVTGNDSLDLIALKLHQVDGSARAIVQESLAELGGIGVVELIPRCHYEDHPN